jgi:hypothetical protein
MSSINNIEKLIQIATIEQMYLMLEKLKSNNTTDTAINTTNTSNTNDLSLCLQNNIVFGQQIDNLKQDFYNFKNLLNTSNNTICKLSAKINELEQELNFIKNNNDNNNYFDYQQIKGQQTLDSYYNYGFFNQSNKEVKTCDYIKKEIIKNENDVILEEDIEYFEQNKKKPVLFVINEDEDENFCYNNVNVEEQDNKNVVDVEETFINNDVTVEEQDDNTVVDEEETFINNDVTVEEQDDKTVVDEEETLINNDVTVEKEEEEEEEEEVGTEDESETFSYNNISIIIEEKEQHTEEKKVEEEEEEEEEVFEIEIDDITYFATDEENGILYEMTNDGDIGKKVGIIKDGEPIFN